MSLVVQQKIKELEERILVLESQQAGNSLVDEVKRLSNEIQAIKMRMGKNDGKRTP